MQKKSALLQITPKANNGDDLLRFSHVQGILPVFLRPTSPEPDQSLGSGSALRRADLPAG